MNRALIRTEGLCKYFFRSSGLLQRREIVIRAADAVDVTARTGETLALVGESGSGKTTLGKTMIRIYKPTKGKIWFNKEDISSIVGAKLK